MREADERALAEIQAAIPDLTEDELREYRELLSRIPDEINTRIVRRHAD